MIFVGGEAYMMRGKCAPSSDGEDAAPTQDAMPSGPSGEGWQAPLARPHTRKLIISIQLAVPKLRARHTAETTRRWQLDCVTCLLCCRPNCICQPGRSTCPGALRRLLPCVRRTKIPSFADIPCSGRVPSVHLRTSKFDLIWFGLRAVARHNLW